MKGETNLNDTQNIQEGNELNGSFYNSLTQFRQSLELEKNAHLENKNSMVGRGMDYDDEEEEDDDAQEKLNKNVFTYRLIAFLHNFLPNYTPVFMMTTLFIVSAFVCFLRASKGGSPLLLFLTLYLAISFAVWLLFLLCRVVILYILHSYSNIESSKLYNVLASILNPEGVYLACTIFLYVFWQRAAIPITNYKKNTNSFKTYGLQSEDLSFYRFLGISSLVAPATEGDRQVLRRAEIFLIIWSSRNVMMNIAVFFFLVSFMRNVNRNLVQFLTIYSLVRQLNSRWITLTPIITELANERGRVIERDANEGTDRSRREFVNKSYTNKCDGNAKTEQRHHKQTLGVSHIINARRNNSQIPKGSTDMSFLQDEMIAEEGHAFNGNSASLTFNKQRLGSISKGQSDLNRNKKKINKKLSFSDLCQVELNGSILPPELLQENIEYTERSGLANLLSVYYVQNNLVVLFVRGVRVELDSKEVARLVGKQLFDELMEFRNAVAPDDGRPVEELDGYVKQSVIQKVELHRSYSHNSENFINIPMSDQHNPPKNNLSDHLNEKKSKLSDVTSNFEASSKNVNILTQQTKCKSEKPLMVQENRLPGNFVPVSSNIRGENDILEAENSPIKHHNSITSVLNKLPSHETLQATLDGPAIAMRRIKTTKTPIDDFVGSSRQYLTLELFGIFLGDQVHEFMKYADPGGRDRVSSKQFTRMIVDLYQMQKQLVTLIDSQKGIQNVFQRMVSIFLGFLCVLLFLVVLGLSVNTVFISGAASISSMTVALSFLYSGFIQSVMFICFVNPYNVGDRVRIENELLIVKKISTYFSEFVSVPYNKPSFWNHSLLYNTIVINESRCRNAGLEIPISLTYNTDPTKYDKLHAYVENYVNTDPEFVKGSLFLQANEVVLGHYIKFTYWISCTESWHRWKSVYATQTRLLLAIAHKCTVLGLTYHLPVQPVSVSQATNRLKQGSGSVALSLSNNKVI